MTFQDGRHSILSLVCLSLLCSVFKVRFFKLKIENGKLKIIFPFQSYLNFLLFCLGQGAMRSVVCRYTQASATQS